MSSTVLSARTTALGARAVVPRHKGHSSRARASRVITNFAPANGDFGFSLPEGAAAGAAVLGARVFFIGLAKAGIGRRVDTYMETCAEYGISTDDLFYTEDEPGDAWYLVGDWAPAKAGASRHSDTTLVGILTTRARTGELITECREKGIDVADILTTDYAPSFITNEKNRFNAINTRLRQAKA